MAKIVVERFRSGNDEEDRTERHEADHAMGHKEVDGVIGVQRVQYARIMGRLDRAGRRDDEEPDGGNRGEQCRYARRAMRLHGEQCDENDDRDRQHIVLERMRGDVEPFDRR